MRIDEDSLASKTDIYRLTVSYNDDAITLAFADVTHSINIYGASAMNKASGSTTLLPIPRLSLITDPQLSGI